MLRGQDRSVELVDVFADAPVPGTGDTIESARSGTGPPRWSGLVVAAVALLVGGVVVRGQARSGPRAPVRPSASVAANTGVPARLEATAPVTVVNAGRRLLDVPTRWDLFGLGSGVLVRVQLAQGRVTVTRLPGSALAPVALLALPGRVVVRPMMDGTGYVVPDGAAASRLSGLLGQAGPAVAGPQPGQVWVRTSPATQDATRLTLIGPGNRAVGATVDVPGDGYLSNDGTGHVMYATRVDDDDYLTSPGRWHFHTSGQLLAAGANEVVTIERDGAGRYSTVLTEVLSGRRRVWAARGLLTDPVLGPVAPDGRTAAILTSAATATTLRLLDLTTGILRSPAITLAGNAEIVAWSPDGRWLFAAAHDGQVVAIDARTGAVHRLEVALPPLTQLVLRS